MHVRRLLTWSGVLAAMASVALMSQSGAPTTAVVYEGARIIAGDGTAAVEKKPKVAQPSNGNVLNCRL